MIRSGYGEPSQRRREAVTLLEMVVAMGIAVVLLVLAITGFRFLEARKRSLVCQHNLKTIYQVCRMWGADHGDQVLPFWDEKAGGYWFFRAAPYFGGIHTRAWTCPDARRVAPGRIFPNADFRNNPVTYAGPTIWAAGGQLEKRRWTTLEKPERMLYHVDGWHSFGTEANFLKRIYFTAHNGAPNVLFCDGHIRPVSDLKWQEVRNGDIPPY